MKKTINFYAFSLFLAALAGCSGPTAEKVKEYSKQCVTFYEEKRADRLEYVTYRSSWMKEGRLVISLAVKKYKDDSEYTEGLCVVDMKEGTISLPGLFNQGKWQK